MDRAQKHKELFEAKSIKSEATKKIAALVAQSDYTNLFPPRTILNTPFCCLLFVDLHRSRTIFFDFDLFSFFCVCLWSISSLFVLLKYRYWRIYFDQLVEIHGDFMSTSNIILPPKKHGYLLRNMWI